MSYTKARCRGDRDQCRCTGDCGDRRCLGYLTWGKACATRPGEPHPTHGEHVTLIGGFCQFCREAVARRDAARDCLAEALTTGDGHTQSLFSLVAGGGLR